MPSPITCALRGTRLGSYLYKNQCWKKEESTFDVERVDCVPGAFLAVNITNFLEIGGYDESVFLYWEESIIGAKAKEKGFSTVLLTNDYYLHEHSVSINKSIPQKKRQMEILYTSRLYFLKEYLHSKAFVIQLAKLVQKRRLRKM